MGEKLKRGSAAAAEALDWPRWVPVASAALPAGIVIDVLIQHHRSAALGTQLAMAALVLAPWLVEAAGVEVNRWVFGACVLTGTALLLLTPLDVDPTPFLVVFMTAELVARNPIWFGALAATASGALMVAFEVHGRYTGSWIWVMAIGVGWGAGYMLRSQLSLIQKLRAAQADLAERAAAGERQRIAREVHDVIAHSLTVTILHMTGARLALQADPPEIEEATQGLHEAERLGRQSLSEIRRTVGLLDPGADPTAAPQPGAADLPGLVADMAAAGLDIRLTTTGDADALPSAMGLSLYRVVQESLSNAARHAPAARVVVGMDVTSEEVRLRVTNGPAGRTPEPAPASGGLGIQGMRERMRSLGGTLGAGPHGDGWMVEAVVPRVREPA